MRTNSKTFKSLNDSISQVTEGRIRDTIERVKNKLSGGRYETKSEADARKKKTEDEYKAKQAAADKDRAEYAAWERRTKDDQDRRTAERERRERDARNDPEWRKTKGAFWRE